MRIADENNIAVNYAARERKPFAVGRNRRAERITGNINQRLKTLHETFCDMPLREEIR